MSVSQKHNGGNIEVKHNKPAPLQGQVKRTLTDIRTENIWIKTDIDFLFA